MPPNTGMQRTAAGAADGEAAAPASKLAFQVSCAQPATLLMPNVGRLMRAGNFLPARESELLFAQVQGEVNARANSIRAKS